MENAMEVKDKVRTLRESTGMNRKEFCEYFGIPYRTMTEWELGHRKLPDYVLRMMIYQIKMEKLDVHNVKDKE
jgi:DNA-binding transcriptional regulator YiaG